VDQMSNWTTVNGRLLRSAREISTTLRSGRNDPVIALRTSSPLQIFFEKIRVCEVIRADQVEHLLRFLSKMFNQWIAKTKSLTRGSIHTNGGKGSCIREPMTYSIPFEPDNTSTDKCSKVLIAQF